MLARLAQANLSLIFILLGVGSTGVWLPQGISVGSASPTGDSAVVASKQGRIAFARDHQIYVVNPDGSGLKLLQIRPNVKPNCEEGPCTFEWFSPAWSPNGKRLALVGHVEDGTLSGDNRVYITDMNGRARAVFVSDIAAFSLSWSPNGVCLAHDTGRDWPTPILIRVRTHKARFLVTAVGKRPTGRGVAWAPSGDRLAFEYARGSTGDFPIWRGIATIRSDGTNFRALTNVGADPDWSPDGTQIAFGSAGIRTVDRNGRQRLIARAGANPSWSPDGFRIVFERGRDLWIMDRRGGHLQLLVREGSEPDWSPD